MSDASSLREITGSEFRDDELLRTALTHPSAVPDESTSARHNQRLEFLGDAVLQLVLTSELYRRYPALAEGAMTRARARLANRRFLAEQARRLRLGEHLVLSRGEEAQGGRDRSSILADAFEALLGAIYLDAGYEVARAFVLRHLEAHLQTAAVIAALDNPKGALQELLQSSSIDAPEYHVTNVSGPDHARQFECAVCHGGRELGRGTGSCKKEAEAMAAGAALERLREAEGAAGAGQTLNLKSSTSPSRTM